MCPAPSPRNSICDRSAPGCIAQPAVDVLNGRLRPLHITNDEAAELLRGPILLVEHGIHERLLVLKRQTAVDVVELPASICATVGEEAPAKAPRIAPQDSRYDRGAMGDAGAVRLGRPRFTTPARGETTLSRRSGGGRLLLGLASSERQGASNQEATNKESTTNNNISGPSQPRGPTPAGACGAQGRKAAEAEEGRPGAGRCAPRCAP